MLLSARRLRRRHEAVASAGLPPLDPDGERLVDAPAALYHGTRFADGARLLITAWQDACVCDLWCTAEAVFIVREEGGPAPGERLAVPLAWVDEAALVREFAPLAKKDLPMLRLRWRRGGEALVTDVSLRGGMAELERLRREIHLRMSAGAATRALQPLLEREPQPGGGRAP